MPKRKGSIKLKAKWKIDSHVILKSNVFRVVYTPTSSVLYFGLIDPEDMLPKDKNEIDKVKEEEKVAEVKTLARYSLDHDEIIRLKNEIDKAVEGLKKSGAIKNEK